MPALLVALALCIAALGAPGVAAAATAPAAPSGLTAHYLGGAIQLTWQDNAVDEAGFSVERCFFSGCTTFAEIATTSANVASFADVTWAPTANRYRVRAFNEAGFSAYSNVAEEIVFSDYFPPTAVASAAPSSGYAPLAVVFDGSQSHANGATLVSWSWSFGDGTSGSGATTGHTYAFAGSFTATLTITDSLGATSSASVAIAVSQVVLAPPTDLSASSPAKGRVSLTWTNPVSTTNAIAVERCRGTGCTKFSTVVRLRADATGWVDTGLKPGTTYRYRLRVTDATGAGAYSNVATVTAR